MDLGLKDRKVLITGASRGIGYATASSLAAEGASLAIVGRDQSRIESVGEKLRNDFGVEVSTIAGDLAEVADVQRIAEEAGDIDVLVNNAGAIPDGTLNAITLDVWQTAWNLKVFGYIYMCRALYPKMCDRGSGVILNVIGVAGERPFPSYIVGSVGNAALYTFTRTLGSESLDRGVRVLGVSPGFVDTDRRRKKMRDRALATFGDAERWGDFTSKLPAGKLANPREIADVIAFLVSDRASYISGTVVTVDAGVSARGMPL